MEAMVSRHFGHDREILPWPSRPCGSKGATSYYFPSPYYSTARYEKLHSGTSPDNHVVFKHLPETGWEEVASVRPVLVQKMSPGELRCSCVLDITALSCIFFAHNGLCT